MTFKYNPGFSSDAEILKAFVVRKTELESVLQTLAENHGASNQHVLIVGPRGTGKTMLVRCVAATVRSSESLNQNWYPLVFGEESYGVTSPGEFWLEALFHLADQTENERWQRVYEELREERDEKRLQQRAIAQLMDFADEQGKKILLIAENLNMMFEEQFGSNDDWDLRHTLQNESRLMLLGTATQRFDVVDKFDRAWFELFEIQTLDSLNLSGCQQLWEDITGEDLSEQQIRPLRILTGGNPRLLRVLAEFAQGLSFQDLMANLNQLIDEHTDYFKSLLENIAPKERKVFTALLELWDPAGAQDVAKAARMDVNNTSALLKRLERRGAIEVIDKTAGKKKYQVAERLFNIYYLMRRRGNPENRVIAAVDFMVSFYEGDSLIRRTMLIANEACCLSNERSLEHIWAYHHVLQRLPNKEIQQQILNATPSDFFELDNAPDFLKNYANFRFENNSQDQCKDTNDNLKQETSQNQQSSILYPGEMDAAFDDAEQVEIVALLSQGASYIEENNYSAAEEAYRKAIAINSQVLQPWGELGHLLHYKLGRFEEAEKAYQKVIEIKSESLLGWFSLGQLYHDALGRFEEAEKAYRKALTVDPDNAEIWGSLGQLLHNHLGRCDDAEAAYRNAISFSPEYAWAWGNLGILLHKNMERFEDAEEAYKTAITLDPNASVGWGLLGQLFHENLSRFEEAENAYQKAIEISPNYSWAWAQLGLLLHTKLERFKEAEEAYRTAININPEYAWAWIQLGDLLYEKLTRFEEAEEAYCQAININPEYALAWASLGQILCKESDRFEEAENAYQKAIEISPNYSWAWAQLGLLLHTKLERFKEAEEAYRTAININPEYVSAWIQLGSLLDEQLGQYIEAHKVYQEAVEFNPESAWAWEKLGRLLHGKLERFEEAEQAYQHSVELNPDNADVWGALGELLHMKLGRFKEAEKAYEKALCLAPQYAPGWGLLGDLLHDKLEHFEEAEKAYQKALDIDSNLAWVWLNLAGLLNRKLKRMEEGIDAYFKAFEVDPQFTLNFVNANLSRLETDLDLYKQMKLDFKMLLTDDPENSWAWAQLGSLFTLGKKEYKEAEEAYHQAITIDPSNSLFHMQLGLLFDDGLERFEEAEVSYRQAITLDSDNSLCWTLLGSLLHEKLERFEEAEEAYRQAIASDPKNTLAWGPLMKLLLERGEKWQTVLQLKEQCLNKIHRNSVSLNAIALSLLEFGSSESLAAANELAREAVAQMPDNLEVLHTQLRILGALDQWDEALEQSKKFLEARASDPKAKTEIIDFIISAAAAGHGEQALKVLNESAGASYLEPLIVGLQIFRGDRPLVAQEIFEVGQDVAERIREKQVK